MGLHTPGLRHHVLILAGSLVYRHNVLHQAIWLPRLSLLNQENGCDYGGLLMRLDLHYDVLQLQSI